MSTNTTTEQSRLLGAPAEEGVHITTSGRTIRPALALPAALVDECKLAADAEGIHIRAVDQANIAMIDLTIHAAAFDEFAVSGGDEFLAGIDLSTLRSTLRKARKGRTTDDAVALDVDAVRTIVEIERDYDHSRIEFADEVLSLDPDAVRQRPELPDLGLPCSATVDVQALADAVDHIDIHGDHMALARDGNDLVVSGGSNDDSPAEYAAAVRFQDALIGDSGDDPDVLSMFTLDYLKDISGALDTALLETVTVEFGDESPARFLFERTANETTLYAGEIMVAPRLSNS